MTRGTCLIWLGLAASVFGVSGCEQAPVGVPHTHNPAAEITLCGLCGEIDESDKCCKEGIALCPKCGLHKGSILCCSTAFSGAPRDVILCRKCGEVAFGKKCCKVGPVLCTKCGLHKGSPGCCKIEKVAEDVTGQEYEHAHAEGDHGHS